MYQPRRAPDNPESLADFIQAELQLIADSINNTPKYTAEQLRSKASDVNRRGKSEGRPVWDRTSKKPVWPTGSDSGAAWIFGDGSIAYSPI